MNGETIVLQSPGAPELLLTSSPDVMITLDGGLDGHPGKDGKDGTNGLPGAPGKDGVGVIPGGTTGQVLGKKTDSNYDTQWITVAGGGLGASADSPFEDLYRNPNNKLVEYAATLPAGITKTRMEWAGARPQAFWSGIEWDPEGNLLGDVVAAGSAIAKTSQVVLYSIVHRDGGGYSTGGADTEAEYDAWIAKISAKIGQTRTIIILEPDALGQIDLLNTETDKEARYRMLSNAINTFKTNNPNARVYIDAGNPSWQPVAEISDRLSKANIDTADGIALNVSNFQSDTDNITYGQAILQDLGVLGSDKGFVIDTSRNGNTVQEGTFNPPNRQFGKDPRFGSTGTAGLHGYLWIKGPGESDGASEYIAFDNTTQTAPAAGQFFPLYMHNPDVADYTDSPDLGKGSGMTQRQPATSLIPYSADDLQDKDIATLKTDATALRTDVDAKLPLTGGNMTGNVSITADYAGGTFVNTTPAQYGNAGFKMYSNQATLGNNAGVDLIAQITDTAASVGEFVLNKINYQGNYVSTLMNINLNTNTTNFQTALQQGGATVPTVSSVDTLTNKTLVAPKLETASTAGQVWTATDAAGNGAWAAGGGGGGGESTPKYLYADATRYDRYFCAGWESNSYASATIAINSNRAHAYPIIIGTAVTLRTLTVQVTTAVAGSVGRMGLYTNVSSTTAPYPKTLIVETAELNTGNTGVMASAVTATLAPGLYWMVLISDGGITVRGLPTASQKPILGTANLYEAISMVAAIVNISPGVGLPAEFPVQTGLVPVYEKATTIPAMYYKLGV